MPVRKTPSTTANPTARRPASRRVPLKWDDLDARLLWSYEGPIRDPFRHFHYPGDVIRAWLLREGSLTMHFPGGSEVFRRGHWVFPRLTQGVQEFSADADILSVRFMATVPDGRLLFEGMGERSVALPENEAPDLTRFGERLARIVESNQAVDRAWSYQPRGIEDYLECQHVFYGWILAFWRAMKHAGLRMTQGARLDERIIAALRRLDEQTSQAAPREGELARLAGLSVSQFNRLFIGQVGCTPIAYRDRRKTDLVRIALQETERSIKSIAYGFGFKTLSHFSVWTRKHLGASPRDVRWRRDG